MHLKHHTHLNPPPPLPESASLTAEGPQQVSITCQAFAAAKLSYMMHAHHTRPCPRPLSPLPPPPPACAPYR
jgi:hypothetical protein